MLLAVPAAPSLAATAAELAAARAALDRTSAELAQARTAAERLGGDERAELMRLERRLQRQKDALVALESGIEARHAAEEAAEADAPLPPSTPSGDRAGDGPVVVLGDRPRDDDPATGALLSATGVATLPDERRPAVSGDDAAVAARIDAYLAAKASPLTGLGAVFVTESRAQSLDPLFLVAISGAETSFGTYGPSQTIRNPFGMGPHIVYASWSESIRAAARNLGGDLYAGSGLTTISAIQARWAPNGATNDPTGLNSNWTRNVSTYLVELGGDPAAAVFTTLPASPAAAPAAGVPGPAGAPVIAPVVPVIAPAPTLGASGRGADAAEAALAQLGVSGERGGDAPGTGFDASGLVAWAYREQGVTLPRDAIAQSRVGTAVEPADLEAGDAVFFSDPSGLVVGVGLYLGDGQFVHAPGAGEAVTIASLYEPHHAESYAGARRY